ncbi:hypothetical protein [Thermoflexus sp.]|uniref:hypothetical protein n=1 Tax=Thermoflexus sp. TaxID=1969742 RepID=UPI0035E42DA3
MRRTPRLILAFAFGFGGAAIVFTLSSGHRISHAGNSGTWITAVHPDGLFVGEPDEAVQLLVLGPASVDLGGWTLRDRLTGTGGLRFPPGFIITPGVPAWVAHHAPSFTLAFGRPPDAAVLRDSNGSLVDAVLHGAGYTETLGWPTGSELRDPRCPERGPDPGPSRGPSDQAPHRHRYSQRLGRRCAGSVAWAPERYEQPFQFAGTTSVTLIIAPDHTCEAVAAWIDEAQASIVGEMFTLEHPRLAERMAAAA